MVRSKDPPLQAKTGVTLAKFSECKLEIANCNAANSSFCGYSLTGKTPHRSITFT